MPLGHYFVSSVFWLGVQSRPLGQKAAMEDVFNNRFKKYQTSATAVKDIANVHASLYKVISWANAKYDEKKIDQLGKEQLAIMERTVAMVGKALKSEGLTAEEKNLYQAITNQLASIERPGFQPSILPPPISIWLRCIWKTPTVSIKL